MVTPSKTLAPNGALVDLQTGRATPPFNNYLNNLTQNVNAASAGTVTTAPGSGLFGGGNVADGISIGIAANGVSNAMIRQSSGYSVIGRAFGSAGDVADITATADNRILARIGGVLAFWDLTVVPATVADGNYGDITVSGTGTAWAINANAVSNAKFRQSTALTVVGRSSNSTGNVADISGTASQFLGVNAAGTVLGFQTMAGDATLSGPTITLATVNTNIGAWGSATQSAVVTLDAKGRATAASNVTITPAASSITGGAALTKSDDTNVTLTLGGAPTTSLLAATSLGLGWTGQLSIARGGTSASTAAGARTALGLGPIVTNAIDTPDTGGFLKIGKLSAGQAAFIQPASDASGLVLQDQLGHSAIEANGTTRIIYKTDGTAQLTSSDTGVVIVGTLSAASLTLSSPLAVGQGGTGVTSLGNITRTNDTNVTLTLGGTPTGAVITSTSLTLGWTGRLAYSRFVAATQKALVGATAAGDFGEITLGSGVAITAGVLSATGTGGTVTTVSVVTANGFSGTVANDSTTPAITLSYAGAALTKTDDTNVTLTLGGTPSTALLAAASLTLGWTGTLAAGRGGTGVSSLGDITRVNDTNVTLTLGGTPTGAVINSTSFTLGWTGTLAAGRGGTGVSSLGDLTKADDTNVTLTLGGTPTGALIKSASITAGWTGQLSVARGGTSFASYTIGDLIQASATGALAKLAAVATGNVLISGGVGVVSSWGKVGLTTHVSGTLPIANGGTNQTSLGDITRTNDTNVTLTLGGTPTGALITSTSFTLGWTGTLAVSRGGLGVGTVTGILQGNGTSAVTAITDSSTTGQVLRVTGASSYAWGALSLSTAAAITGTLPVGNGGTGITSFGTGVATALGVNVGSAGAFVTFNGAGGTPSSITLTNGTGLPISTGVSGLGTGVATFLATPSSANLAAALTDETGSGAAVFGTSPTIATPTLTGTSIVAQLLSSVAAGGINEKFNQSSGVIVNNANFDFAAGSFNLFFIIETVSFGRMALVASDGFSCYIIWQSGTLFSVTSGAPSTVNLFFNSGAVRAENKSGSSCTFYTWRIGGPS